jgi:hypothetical protein
MWIWLCAKLGKDWALRARDEAELTRIAGYRARLKAGDTLPNDDQARIERYFTEAIRGDYNVAVYEILRRSCLNALRLREQEIRVRWGWEKKRNTKDSAENENSPASPDEVR